MRKMHGKEDRGIKYRERGSSPGRRKRGKTCHRWKCCLRDRCGVREEKKGKQTSERRKYRENEQKGRPLAAPQSFEMPIRSAAETASISPSAAAAEKENDPDTAVVAAVAASASTAVMSVSAAAAQEQDDPDHVVAASAAS